MENLNISTGEIRLAINGDEDNLLVFNPEDVVFAERFYELAKNFSAKEKEFNARIIALQANKHMDEHGLPANTGDTIDLTRELCEYMREQLDIVFGDGTCQRLFGDVNSINMLTQFLEGIEPYISDARAKKANKYVNKDATPVLK